MTAQLRRSICVTVLVVLAATAAAQDDVAGHEVRVTCATTHARVFVDGEDWGTVPAQRNTAKASGRLKVEVLLADHAVARRSVSIKRDGATVVEFRELKEQTWPRLTAPDGVAVGWLSDDFGWWPTGTVPPGKGRPVLGKAACASQILASRRLEPGEEVALEPAGEWQVPPALLRLGATREDGSVQLDGKRAEDGQIVAPGEHELRLKQARGWESVPVTVRPGQPVLRLPVTFSDATRIDAALGWLASHQLPDGHWSSGVQPCRCTPRCPAGKAGHDIGVSGLALLALQSAGHAPGSGAHAEVVEKGLANLLAGQREDGHFMAPGSRTAAFSQPIATIAVLEAWGATGDERYRTAAERALAGLEATQNPYLAWRYGVRDGDNDTAVTCWSVLAFTTAYDMRISREVFADVRPERRHATLRGAEAWLDKMLDPVEGRTGYQRRGGGRAYEQPTMTGGRFPREEYRDRDWSLTGPALLARLEMRRVSGERPALGQLEQLMVQGLKDHAPYYLDRDDYADVHALWFGARALRQATGEIPYDWRSGLETLASKQRENGSFEPDLCWSPEGGAVFTTALAALSLQEWLRD